MKKAGPSGSAFFMGGVIAKPRKGSARLRKRGLERRLAAEENPHLLKVEAARTDTGRRLMTRRQNDRGGCRQFIAPQRFDIDPVVFAKAHARRPLRLGSLIPRLGMVPRADPLQKGRAERAIPL